MKMDDSIAKGRIMLLSVGIFMIIIGASNILSNVYQIFIMTNEDFSYFDYFNIFDLEFFNFLSMSISNTISVIVGIVGVVFSNKPKRGNICMVLAIIMIALPFLWSLFFGIYWISEEGIDRLGMLINGVGGAVFVTIQQSSALPVLYLIGAVLNKKSIIQDSPCDAEIKDEVIV